MNVKIIFLNDNREKEIYKTQSERFISSGRTNQVCKLKKSIYELKQFDKIVKEFDFIKNEDEPYVYEKTSESAIILILYVDDLIENNIPI